MAKKKKTKAELAAVTDFTLKAHLGYNMTVAGEQTGSF